MSLPSPQIPSETRAQPPSRWWLVALMLIVMGAAASYWIPIRISGRVYPGPVRYLNPQTLSLPIAVWEPPRSLGFHLVAVLLCLGGVWIVALLDLIWAQRQGYRLLLGLAILSAGLSGWFMLDSYSRLVQGATNYGVGLGFVLSLLGCVMIPVAYRR